MMATWSPNATVEVCWIVFWVVFLAGLDFFVTRSNSARWYILHAVANLGVTITSVSDVCVAFSDPIHSMESMGVSPSGRLRSPYPMRIIAALHIFHMLAFKCSKADYFHHFLFVGLLCPAGLLCDWGPLQNAVSLFLCGLPGGIDYAMLAMVRHDILARLTEKTVNSYINVWLRGPGCLFTAFCMYTSWLYGEPEASVWIIVAILSLVAFNGQYYLQRVTANWGFKGGHPS